MQWHPTLSTLLMVACEDDMSPVIQLWDLRSAAAMTPAKELLGHNKVSLMPASAVSRRFRVAAVGFSMLLARLHEPADGCASSQKSLHRFDVSHTAVCLMAPHHNIYGEVAVVPVDVVYHWHREDCLGSLANKGC